MMVLHLLYVVLFTVLAVCALGNLLRNLMMLSMESRHPRSRSAPHPELLDAEGQPLEEPLLVVRSVDLEQARQQLERLYEEGDEAS